MRNQDSVMAGTSGYRVVPDGDTVSKMAQDSQCCEWRIASEPLLSKSFDFCNGMSHELNIYLIDSEHEEGFFVIDRDENTEANKIISLTLGDWPSSRQRS